MVGAIGQPDAEKGELPCAYVQLNDGETTSSEEILAFCENKITEMAALPKYVEVIEEMPLTAVGKIFKPDLRKKAISRVFDEALSKASIKANVHSVVEHPKEGLKANIVSSDTQENISKVLSPYTVGWEILKE